MIEIISHPSIEKGVPQTSIFTRALRRIIDSGQAALFTYQELLRNPEEKISVRTPSTQGFVVRTDILRGTVMIGNDPQNAISQRASEVSYLDEVD